MRHPFATIAVSDLRMILVKFLPEINEFSNFSQKHDFLSSTKNFFKRYQIQKEAGILLIRVEIIHFCINLVIL